MWIIALVRLPYTLIMPLSSPEVQKSKLTIALAETNLYIPKEWKTENNLGQAFGSVKTHGVCEGSSNNTLKLKGETSFGEINIYYI